MHKKNNAPWESQLLEPVTTLKPYLPGKSSEAVAKELNIAPESIIKLASNENPLGPSPKVQEALLQRPPELNRYPDNDALALKQSLSEMLGVSSSQITLGSGSCEVLDMLGRLFLAPGRGSMYSEHAFAAYPILTQTLGAQHQVVPTQAYCQDLDGYLSQMDENTAVVFITNPSNPTGTWVTEKALLSFLDQLPERVIVVLDEAYFEYAQAEDQPDGVALLKQYPNVVVTRTFSKVYGLASLRIGYAVSSAPLADWMNRVRAPFNVNAFALQAAYLALQDQAHVKASVELNNRGMRLFQETLNEMEVSYIPSRANFITLATKRSGLEVFEALQRQGVITRPIANYGLPQHLRVTLGTDSENTRCIDALVGLQGLGYL